jgi:hypothetical protein
MRRSIPWFGRNAPSRRPGLLARLPARAGPRQGLHEGSARSPARAGRKTLARHEHAGTILIAVTRATSPAAFQPSDPQV